MKEPFGRPKRRWEVNTKMFLKETMYDCVDWIQN
jgi:hypothetical protein